MAADSVGMFGPSADEMRLLLEREGQAADTGWAQMEPGRGPVRGMAQAGRQFGRAIEAAGGYQDPRMAKAKLLEEAKNEVDSSGVSLLEDPRGYYSKAFESLQKRGLTDEAANVYNLLIQSESAQAETALKRAQAEGELNKGRYHAVGKGGSIDTKTGERIEPSSLSSTEKLVTLSPPGSTVKGTGQEQTVTIGSPEFKELVGRGFIDTSKLPSPKSPPATVEIKNINDQNESRNALAKSMAEPILDKARQSRDVLQQTQALRSQLETGSFDPGFLAGTREFLSSAAQYLGVSDVLLEDIRQNPNDATALSALNNQVVAATATMLQDTGQLSKAELDLYTKSNAGMADTAQGMYIINEVTEAKARWNIARAEFLANEYAKVPDGTNNDMAVIAALHKWESENPFRMDKATLERIKHTARLVEVGKQAKDITQIWSPEPSKNSAVVGGIYKYRGSLYRYKGNTKKNGKLVPNLELAK